MTNTTNTRTESVADLMAQFDAQEARKARPSNRRSASSRVAVRNAHNNRMHAVDVTRLFKLAAGAVAVGIFFSCVVGLGGLV